MVATSSAETDPLNRIEHESDFNRYFRDSLESVRVEAPDHRYETSEYVPLRLNRQKPQSFRIDPSGEPLKSPFRQLLWTWLLTLLTSLWLCFTIFFAYNSGLDDPLSNRLLFPTPGKNIAALNILSHISILLLQLVTSDVFEAIRWALASYRGISSFGFLVLSRATSPLGVLYLLFFNWKGKAASFTGEHRIWGAKRYYF